MNSKEIEEKDYKATFLTSELIRFINRRYTQRKNNQSFGYIIKREEYLCLSLKEVY